MDFISRNLLQIIFILCFALMWSLNLFIEWGTDFGVYYALPKFISENFNLYKEVFEHKGPLYFLFTSLTSPIINKVE